ncbi:MAG TPA: UDP-3-O-(3-hydroxymyristoyl)glucosamine N-acyltransferase [Gammaproteobacteria bacterium]|nr:UDP-3-O-(3-hydroxymyristoyl)glucosamine N-acyltransferase [Gammaproteobacteria bacterium]
MTNAKDNRGYTLAEIAEHCDGRVQGDGQTVIRSVATLQHAKPGAISFLANSRYRKYLPGTGAAAVILAAADAPHCPVAALIATDPYVAYAKAAQLLAPVAPIEPGVHPAATVADDAIVDPRAQIAAGAVVGAEARVAAGVFVGPNCVVQANANLDADVRLVANVTICERVRIGARTLIHPGVVVGADGFGIADQRGEWLKVPQVGGVVIGADVEIGANTTIDRGAIEDTVIEDGVKVDNLVQIGHNVRIGAHSAIAGCCGISGSAVIGRHCILGGRVGVVGHIEIADNTIVTGATVVSRSITEPGIYSGSMPMDTAKQWRKNSVRIRQLDDLARRVHFLEKKLKDQD